MVKQCAENGIINLVISNSGPEHLNRALSSLGIAKYVQTAGQDLTGNKITSEHLSSILKEINLSWDECVTIQSTPAGIAAANSLSMRCIAVPGIHSRSDLGDSDLLVDSLEYLTPLNLEHTSRVFIPQPPLSVRKWVLGT